MSDTATNAGSEEEELVRTPPPPARAFYEIDGQVVDAEGIPLPVGGREFRAAWQWDGQIISIDMERAREVKIEKVYEKAQEKIARFEEQIAKKAIKGDDTTVEEAEVAKFKAKPKKAGRDLIANATTPEQLLAITEDEVYA